MFRLYCLPGRILAHLQWLFPSGWFNALETERRRDSTFIHFLFSTAFYVVVIGLFLMSLGSGNRSTAEASPETLVSSDAVDQGGEAESGRATSNEDISEQAANMEQDRVGEEAPSSVPEAPAEEASAPQSAYPTPDTSEALASSIRQAAESGNPIRWKEGDFAGYAVPSEAQSGGTCRNVFYTVDSDGSGWKSEPVMICP